jgi:hypothetical protein
MWLTATMLTIVFSLRSLAETASEEELGLMDQYDATLLALVVVAALGATAVAITQAAIRTRQRTAFLVIGGLPPAAAASHFTRLVLGVCVAASAAGVAAGWILAPAASRFIAWASSGRPGLTGRADVHALVGAFVITFGLAFIASTRGAAIARSVEPIEALKQLPFRPQARPRWRSKVGLLCGIGALMTGALTIYLPGARTFTGTPIEAANAGVTAAAVTTALLGVFFALTAPNYCPFLIRAWTVFIPERRMPALFLGRRGAAYQAGRSLESFNVVLIGALLTGSVFSIYLARSALDPAGRGWVEARDISGAVLAAVPLLLAMTGSTMTVLATARSRVIEARVLRLSGATSRQVLVAGFTEAFILAATATAVALAGVALVGLCTGLGLARVVDGPGWPETLGFDPPVWLAPLGVTVFGLVLVTAATLPSLIRGLHTAGAPSPPV